MKLKIDYENSKDYKILAANGVWGGVTPQGDIMADFFIERRSSPTSLELEVDGSAVKELSRQGERLTREMQIGLILRPEFAYSLGQWLLERAKEAGYQEIKG